MDVAQGSSIDWHNALSIGIEGKGWDDTIGPYERLPAKSEGKLRPGVWSPRLSTTGMAIRFRTGTGKIFARWRLLKEQLDEPNFNRCAFSGLDLYGDDNGTWRWVAATTRFEGQNPEVCIVEGLDAGERDYLLYLPLRNNLTHLEVGVPAGDTLKPLPPPAGKPLVVYGTSIVHGAYASRAGMVYPSILGRRLDREVINLGFSGNAHMDIELADLLGELDPALYILDPMPNMTLEFVEERMANFILRLRQLRPETSIVLVEDFPRTNSWVLSVPRREIEAKNQKCREIAADLIKNGLTDFHYIQGNDLVGTDGEASIDGIHPTDVGFLRIADCLEPVLRQILSATSTK